MSATIKKETIQFLRDLRKNNNRDWFEKNKDKYIEASQNWLDFVGSIIEGISKFDKGVAGMEPKKCVFRIYRDIRFSKDKSPYKTNFAAKFMPHTKAAAAGYYIHIGPGEMLLAGGNHMLEPKELKALREEISENAKGFLKLINNKSFKSTFRIEGEKLANVPKGFDKEDPMAEYLKHKELYIVHDIAEKDIYSDKFADTCVKVFKQMVPYNNFVNKPVLSA